MINVNNIRCSKFWNLILSMYFIRMKRWQVATCNVIDPLFQVGIFILRVNLLKSYQNSPDRASQSLNQTSDRRTYDKSSTGWLPVWSFVLMFYLFTFVTMSRDVLWFFATERKPFDVTEVSSQMTFSLTYPLNFHGFRHKSCKSYTMILAFNDQTSNSAKQ